MAAKSAKQETPVEKMFQFSEKQVDTLLQVIAKLPWEQANPMIKFIQDIVQPQVAVKDPE